MNIVIFQFHGVSMYLWMFVCSELQPTRRKDQKNAVHNSRTMCRPERRYVNGSLIKALLRICLCVCVSVYTWKQAGGKKVPLSGDEGIAFWENLYCGTMIVSDGDALIYTMILNDWRIHIWLFSQWYYCISIIKQTYKVSTPFSKYTTCLRNQFSC